MTVTASRTARLLNLSATAWKQSEVNKSHARLNEWATAYAASKVVGKYNGGTAAISAQIGTSDDTVERLAAAWVIFDILRHTDAQRARKNRRVHSYGRFLSLGVLWKRYEFDALSAFDYLESGLKIAAMEMQIEDEHNPLPEWHRRGINIYGLLQKLVTDVDLPADILETAEELKRKLARLTL